MAFYETLEPGIREMVRLLRNNGFNTTGSCEHEMYVDIDLHAADGVDQLYRLLFDGGHRGFKIECCLMCPPDGFTEVRASLRLKEWMP